MIYIATLSAEDPDGMNQAFTYTVRDSHSFRIGGNNKMKELSLVETQLPENI
jgi:hypothetical protein